MIQAALHAWTINNLSGQGKDRQHEKMHASSFVSCFLKCVYCKSACVGSEAESLTEVDEEAAIALTLILWKNHDA